MKKKSFSDFGGLKELIAKKINEKFGINFEEKYSKILKKYFSSGHLEKTGCSWKLTNSGILVSNVILSEFIE